MIARRKLVTIAGGAALLGVVPVRASPVQVRVHSGPAFGSAWRLVLADSRAAALARSRLQAVVARVDALMSPYRPDSELARFNATGATVMSLDTAHVTRASLAMARDSDGAFDPTLAPLGRRYGFGPGAISPDRPSGRYRDLRVNHKVVETAYSGLSLDLCGIAKGYALDQIVAALDGLDFLLELGGEVAARGRHPSGRRWRAGIERPDTEIVQRMVQMDTRALATSGDAAQSYVVGPRRYTHVLDRRTRAPVHNQVASVSVLAQTGLLADGLATAAMVMGPQAARPLLKAHGASALFLMRGAEGLEEIDVNGFIAKGPA